MPVMMMFSKPPSRGQ